ncbi:fungal-specific transcription factor domain-containing protein [Lenzites betulinus]|nr:fungal-specific transcription factor domain-containing protein [Lenzites betulinus]
MDGGALLGWAPGQPTAVIDLGEEFAPDPPSASSAALQFSAAYYAIDSSADRSGSKKRKVERACDFCRRRKARCDGPRMPDNVCSNCITNTRTCTYLYVVGLEDRVEKMEALLKRLRPEADLTAELGPPIVRDSWKTDSAQLLSSSDKARSDSPQALEGRDDPRPRPIAGRKVSRSGKSRQPSGQEPSSNSEESSSSSLSDSSDTDEAGELSIVRGMKRLTLRGLEPTEASPDRYGNDNQWRFHGKSSSFKLISTTRDLRQKHIVENGSTSDARQSYSPDSIQLPNSLDVSVKRAEFWQVTPWEKAYEHADDPTVLPDFLLPAFPPPDLSETLIQYYFQYNNNTFPASLSQRPLTELPADRLPFLSSSTVRHLSGSGVTDCIPATRWSSDPRVLPDEVADKVGAPGEDDGIWTLAGWKYIAIGTKLHEARRSVLLPPELFEIQSFALIGAYFRGTVAQQGSWFYLSVGVLKAQDVGAHRRKIYGRTPTIEEELWKRAYWHLVAFDRIGSMLIGRECCTREEDLDLELPLEVDDEYWENDNPALAFRQPEGKPSIVTAFVHWIKLSHIVAFTLKTLYSNNKPDSQVGATAPKAEVVQQLNEALSKWLDEIPPHLQWRPGMEDRAFASQAATLYTTYQMVQILIYRPFIRIPRGIHMAHPIPPRRQAFSQKSLAICLSSARAASYILDVQISRGMLNITNIIHVSYVCAGVLLMHLWDLIRQYGVQRHMSPPDARAQMSQEISSIMGEIGDWIARLEDVSAKWELAREMLDELKDALPDSPTEDGPPSGLLPTDAEAYIPAYQSISISRSPHDPSPGYPQQISPLTPPDHYTMAEPSLAQPAPRAPVQHFADPSMPMQLSFDSASGLPQLWDMDGAPASPPPLSNFNMYMQQPPPPQQQFAPAPVHKPPAPMPVYNHPHPAAQHPQHQQQHPAPHHLQHPNFGIPPHSGGAQHAAHRNSFHDARPPHLSRLSHSGYGEPFHALPAPHAYGPGPGPSSAPSHQPHPQHPQQHPHPHPHPHQQQQQQHLPPEYPPVYLKQEELPLDERECLRLRLLEDAHRQRQQLAAIQRHPGPFGGPASAMRHPPEQWVNGANRWS